MSGRPPSGFNGPHGLHTIQKWDPETSRTPPLRVGVSRQNETTRIVSAYTDGGEAILIDAYQEGPELAEAVQWLADLAGAMTGMEAKILQGEPDE